LHDQLGDSIRVVTEGILILTIFDTLRHPGMVRRIMEMPIHNLFQPPIQRWIKGKPPSVVVDFKLHRRNHHNGVRVPSPRHQNMRERGRVGRIFLAQSL